MKRGQKIYLERRVVGSFITITSAISPNLLKYSLKLSGKQPQNIINQLWSQTLSVSNESELPT